MKKSVLISIICLIFCSVTLLQTAATEISIIVPVYNARSWLEQYLSNFISEISENIEMICVDAGSSDGSDDILSRFFGADKTGCLHVNLLNDGTEIELAKKIGISEARGTYVVVVDIIQGSLSFYCPWTGEEGRYLLKELPDGQGYRLNAIMDFINQTPYIPDSLKADVDVKLTPQNTEVISKPPVIRDRGMSPANIDQISDSIVFAYYSGVSKRTTKATRFIFIENLSQFVDGQNKILAPSGSKWSSAACVEIILRHMARQKSMIKDDIFRELFSSNCQSYALQSFIISDIPEDQRTSTFLKVWKSKHTDNIQAEMKWASIPYVFSTFMKKMPVGCCRHFQITPLNKKSSFKRILESTKRGNPVILSFEHQYVCLVCGYGTDENGRKIIIVYDPSLTICTNLFNIGRNMALRSCLEESCLRKIDSFYIIKY